MKRIALFPGSFDPFTKGHEDIVLRSLDLFDEIIIAIGQNSNKSRYFDLNDMSEKLKELFKNHPAVSVITYEGLTVELAKEYQAGYLLRGLRSSADFEYEKLISQANRQLSDHLETVFLMTSPGNDAISSSIVREIHKYGGDISGFVPFEL